ncbi:MAG: acetyl-CoA carboxylase carboxyl transferase subunit alpha, partial [Porticoccaceae bacterium]
AMNLKGSLIAAIRELKQIPDDELVERRYQKFRKMGVFEEQLAAEAD